MAKTNPGTRSAHKKRDHCALGRHRDDVNGFGVWRDQVEQEAKQDLPGMGRWCGARRGGWGS